MKKIKRFITITILLFLSVAFSNPSNGQTVNYPSAGGITWYGGVELQITWSGFYGSTVKIELYKGSSLYYIITPSTDNNESYVWTVPSSLLFGSDYRIRITSASNWNAFDESDNYFTIVPDATILTVDGASISGTLAGYSIDWFTDVVEEHWYKFYAPPISSGDNKFFSILANGGLDMCIKLYKADKNTLIDMDCRYLTPYYDAQLGVTSSTGEWYYILVTAFRPGTYAIGVKTLQGIPYKTLILDWPYEGDYVLSPKPVEYRFTTGVAGIYTIQTRGSLNTLLNLYNATGFIEQDDDDGEGANALIQRNLAANTEYIVRMTASSNGYYSIGVNAPIMTLVVNDLCYSSSIFFVTEEDWYKFQTGAAGTYVIEQSVAQYFDIGLGVSLYENDQATRIMGFSENQGIECTLSANTWYYIKLIADPERNLGFVNRLYCIGVKGASLTVSTETISLDYGSGFQEKFNITSNTSWNITKGDSASWLDVSPLSGSNNGTITLTTNSTNTGAARIATIIIKGTGVAPKILTVIQQYQEIITNLLGNTNVFYSISTTESRKAQSMYFNLSGEIESISIYHNGGTGNVLLGVYSDHLGTPSTLLGVTALTPVNKTEGWQTVSLTSPLNLFSGQKIWLSWVFDANPGIRYADELPGFPQAAESPATWSEGLPLNFGTSTTSNIKYSIYCTYKQKPITLSTTSISLGYGKGSRGSFNIYSNTNWFILTPGLWIEPQPQEGSNNGLITFITNEENTGTSPITKTVLIEFGHVIYKAISVTQECKPSTTKTIGNTAVYNLISTTPNRKAQPITFNEAGKIESISVYHNGGTGNVKLGIYSEQAGTPSSLLGVSTSTPINSISGWQTVSLSSPVIVTAGQTIWLSWVFETNPGIRYTAGLPPIAESFETWSGSMPTNFGQADYSYYKYSIYCSYKPTSVNPTLSLSTQNISLGSESGSSGTFNITSNTVWFNSIDFNNDDRNWLSMSPPPTRRIDNGTISVTTISANTGIVPRTAKVSIGYSYGNEVRRKTVTITQDYQANTTKSLSKINYQVWNNIGSSTKVSSLTGNVNYPNNPTSSTLINSMEGTTDRGDSYGARIVGYICAPATGSYTFWIASDDYGELWLSTNDDPANKHKIAYVNGYTWIRTWNKYTTQKSATINLVQGQKYYIEALMKEATGHDNLAVGWLKPGESGTVPSEIIPGSVLSPYGIILVSSVTLPPALNLNTGASVWLPATVLPANATVKTLTWTTSDPTVALVNSYGIVTGISTGNATISATSTDGSNKTGTCVVTVAGVPTICSATGNITYQVWNNIGSSPLVSSLTGNANYPDNPTSSSLITSMEGKTDLGDSYGARIAGYVCAPATGSYTFWIATDDYGELWLSTNDDPANKYKIAYVNGYTWIRTWNKYATQKSATINLVQGQKYYIEALMKEATGHDNLAVGWLKPGESGTVPSEIIPGSVLSPYGTIPVSSVILPPTLDLNTGASVLLPATVLPANATIKSLKWLTSDSTVALVNSNGIVTGISTGSATISALSKDGSYKSGTSVVTVTGVMTICSATGNITYQVWNNIGSSPLVSSLTGNANYPDNPTSSTLITSMEGTTNLGDSYGARIVGYICAPATGSYTFWIASDDYGELWLSMNDNPANKHKIAYVNGYTWIREWNKYATQKSVAINLVQGQKYYIEALMKEATGHDNLAVGWLKPGQSGSVPSEVIPGSVLSPILAPVKSDVIKVDNPASPDMDVMLLVYPNPLITNVLNIKPENLTSGATLRIFTISGVKCYEEIIQNSGIIQVDRSVFKSGMYIIKVEYENFVKTTKLIVN